eukprot:CAMPEP_0118921670 /NCGR_PEP_ID=MMETSP1169-20130426/872_1 /TAXON_ID=36882 /ORGANISM="Pyramimonas obovata, Strain CCMP722" /LENGTH=319 /DNA_ID=CAMNT_0006862433 /DNA_START=168 /DNA_END=1124 /DNA_ORIENTATION=+
MSGPLGLNLRRSDSLIDLLTARLQGTQKKKSSLSRLMHQSALNRVEDTGVSRDQDTPQKEPETQAASSSTRATPPRSSSGSDASESNHETKLKASSFPVTRLRIGNWEYHTKNVGDLVCKCYYAKRKLVWEILHNGLKSKLEMQWSDICALEVNQPDNEPATLNVRIMRPPAFFKETSPQPRKHTLWHPTVDFTGCEASSLEPHSVEVPHGLMNKHLANLLNCDSRLKALVENPRSFPSPSRMPAAMSGLAAHLSVYDSLPESCRLPKRARLSEDGAPAGANSLSVRLPRRSVPELGGLRTQESGGLGGLEGLGRALDG